MGRSRLDPVKLLRIILFAFMDMGYVLLRNAEKLCKTDIHFIRNLICPDFPAAQLQMILNIQVEPVKLLRVVI